MMGLYLKAVKIGGTSSLSPPELPCLTESYWETGKVYMWGVEDKERLCLSHNFFRVYCDLQWARHAKCQIQRTNDLMIMTLRKTYNVSQFLDKEILRNYLPKNM